MNGRVYTLVALFVLKLHWLTTNVVATHFRGGIIMVRPVDGGTPAEVKIFINCIVILRSYSISILVHTRTELRVLARATASTRQRCSVH